MKKYLFILSNIVWASEDFQFYVSNRDYFIKKMDVNGDGSDEFVVSSVANEGNKLIFFREEGGDYIPILESFNLSIDGGEVIDNIYLNNEKNKEKTIVIVTTRPTQEYKHHIQYENESNRWIISYTEYKEEVYYDYDHFTIHCLFPYKNLYLDQIDAPYYENSDIVTSVNFSWDVNHCKAIKVSDEESL